MPNEQSAQEEFLKNLEPDTKDPFAQEEPTVVTPPEGEGEPAEPTAEEKFNRRERRLRDKLQTERESSIALAARLQAISEAQKARSESEPSEHLKSVERIYGMGSPEAIEATELLKTALKGVQERATQDAVERMREERKAEEAAVKAEETSLDSMVEDIEDVIGKDIDQPTRKAFFQMLEKLSPKDADGNITAYADHHAVWEELQARKKPADTRQKDLASRSMVRTGASPSSSVKDDAMERYLRENGLI